MALSAAEQYLIELINRARLDPQAESARYNLALNANLASGTITSSSKQVLAPNVFLETAAVDHSTWMLATNTFSHTGIGGSDPGERIVAAGYAFTGSWSWRENLAWSGTKNAIDLAGAIDTHHEGLYRSHTHRVNTFAEEIREVGAGQVEGIFRDEGVNYNASMLTLNYGKTGYDAFVTGVAYFDHDANNFYGIGEGIPNVTISTASDSSFGNTAGGYGVSVETNAPVEVTLSVRGAAVSVVSIDMTSQNAKLDFVLENGVTPWVYLSASTELISGAPNGRLLGLDDLDLTGNAVANELIGNVGDNVLSGKGGDDILLGGLGDDSISGGSGNDTLEGGGGRVATWVGNAESASSATNADTLTGGTGDDRLSGESGDDILNGGLGDDMLSGGGGRDTFIFNGGHDTISDFTPFVDQLDIDVAALGHAGLSMDELKALSHSNSNGTVINFNADDSLTLDGITAFDLMFFDLNLV